jgi:hypothetical protein
VSASLSARRSAHIFGACSPTVMCSTVINVNASVIETTGTQLASSSTGRPIASAPAISNTETAGSPSAPRIRLASVMPS